MERKNIFSHAITMQAAQPEGPQGLRTQSSQTKSPFVGRLDTLVAFLYSARERESDANTAAVTLAVSASDKSSKPPLAAAG